MATETVGKHGTRVGRSTIGNTIGFGSTTSSKSKGSVIVRRRAGHGTAATLRVGLPTSNHPTGE